MKNNRRSLNFEENDDMKKDVKEFANDDSDTYKKPKLCGSQRLLIAVLLGFCSFTFYAQRQSLNMTILCMVDHKRLKNVSSLNHNHTAACSVAISSPIKDEEDDDLMNGPCFWDKHAQSIILGSFYWGYVFQLFGGAIATRFGSKLILSLAIFVSSASTFLIPFIATWNPYYIVALRVLTGMAQGLMYPCCLPLIAKWAPVDERSSLSSFLAAGSSLGIILATAITGPICQTGYWQFNFIVLASIGFIWLLPWLYFGANNPDESRHIKTSELKHIKQTAAVETAVKSIKEWPIKSILTSRSVLIIIATNVLSDFTLYGIFSVFPLYLWEVYNIDIVTNSYISAGEYVLMWICCVTAGVFSDYFIRNKHLSTLNTRKLFNSLGMFIPAIMFPIIGFMTCDGYKIVILCLVIGGGFPGMFMNAGYLLNTVDVSGSYSGIVIGISNSIGSFSGILAPLVANMLTKDRTMLQWRTCFLVFSGVLLLAGLIFILFAKAKLESWATDNTNENNNTKSAQSPKLRRQFSMDSTGVLVPSNSMDEFDSFNNNVVIYKGYNHNNNNNINNKRYANVQSF